MPSRKATRPDDKRISANRPKQPRVKSRMEQLIDGDITVKDLDIEELQKGQVRGADGKFRGSPRKMFPRDLFIAMQQEWRDRAVLELQEDQALARAALRQVLQDKRAAAQARVNAAAILMDRNLGKVADKVDVTTSTRKYEDASEEVTVTFDVEDEVGAKRATKESA